MKAKRLLILVIALLGVSAYGASGRTREAAI